jgi:hypothetical protein
MLLLSAVLCVELRLQGIWCKTWPWCHCCKTILNSVVWMMYFDYQFGYVDSWAFLGSWIVWITGVSDKRSGAPTLLSPEIRQRRRRSYGTVLGKTPIDLGFSIGRLLIGEGASSGGDQGGLTIGGCGQGLGCAPSLCGQPLAPLRLSFGLWSSSGKNRSSGTCFVQFREYFLFSFSETQKQQKTGNWHCGIFPIG